MRFTNNYWLFNSPIAHRGLWGKDIVENSLTAYKNAVDNNYPIEIDLYTSLDGVIFSFHDTFLKRMTGKTGNIYEKTANQLKELNLLDTTEKIPTLDEVLELVDGQVPLLIELKDQPDKTYVDKVVKRLKSYKGEFAVQSFNPLYIKRVKQLAPEFCRGILATKTHGKHLPFIKRLVVKNMLFNRSIKPDFISYSFEDLPLKKCKTKNIPLITWTITNHEDYQRVKPLVKNIIFENFIPEK